MESSPLSLPRMPNRATSEGPSPPPRNSMEDEDSSVTRKRPRLDSGERAYRSMSADGTLSTHSRAEPGKLLPQQDDNDEFQGQSQGRSIISPNPLNGTPTKVTINLRDSALASSPPRPLPFGSHTSQHGNFGHKLTSLAQDRSSDYDSSSSQIVTTVSSSPPHSPEIEVAELEDVDGHVGPTIWRASESMMSLIDIQTSLFHRFPYVDRYTNAAQAAMTVSQQMIHGDLGNGQLLLDLAQWIEDFLDQTEHLASQWTDMILKAQEFWNKIPQIVNDLMRRSLKFEDSFIVLQEPDSGPDRDNRKYFQEFLVAYTALTARMIQCDCQALTEYAGDTSVVLDLVSPGYMKTFTFLFWNVGDISFWQMLDHDYTYSVVTTIEAIVSRFTNPPSSGFRCISRFVDLLLDRSQNQSGVLAEIWQPINTACRLTTFFPKADIRASSRASTTVAQAFQFFQTVEAKLQIFVAKQVSSLSLELTKALISELAAMLCNVIKADPSISEVMMPRDFRRARDISLEDRSMLVRHAWMFAICKNCITKGRMEIRVLGIDTMQEELVNVYLRYVRPPHDDMPAVPRYLADSILESKLVDYIVGIDSHPQLIHRGKNIVGFLVVTGRYTEAESNTIWKTVASSPDSRTIDAVLDMLAGILGLMNYSSLIYLCQKLNDLPMRFFDFSMLNHCKRLLESLVKKWTERGGVYRDKLDMSPYHLCLRLLREATANTSLAANRRREIRSYALEELRDLMKFGPGDVDRAAILESCVGDIAGRSPVASGSMAVINVLLDQGVEDQMERLVDVSAFASLVVDEFSMFTQVEASKNKESSELHDALAIRLSLLQKIVAYAPSAITSNLAPKLWDNLIGEQAIGDYARDHAWAMLARALSFPPRRNLFLEHFISKQIPQISPRFFTPGVLSFAEKFVQYEVRATEPLVLEAEDRVVNERGPPGAELLWHLALVVPSQYIGSKAAGMLVKAYLDVGITRGTRSPQGNISDAVLVERCIWQLIQAASRLKRLTDGTSSGEDDSMVIVASDNDVTVEKIYFARSLSILKEFMQGIRSLHPGSPASVSVPYSPFTINGDKVSIKYQGFNGSKTTSMRFLEIGDLSTYGEFVKIMSKLTGYPKFSVIAGGQHLRLEASKDMTIRDLKLLTVGLVLVRKLPDVESFPEQVFNVGLTPLEVEVMKHFHELYELLEMEEQQAKDVYDFLWTFPPHEDIMTSVCHGGTDTVLVFSPDAPYKTLYAVYTLNFCLSKQLRDGTSCHQLICRGVQSTVAALLALQISNTSVLSRTETMIATGLVECLLRFLKGGINNQLLLYRANKLDAQEPVPPSLSATYFGRAAALVDRLQLLLTAAQASTSTNQNIWLVEICFSTILEISLCSKVIWNYFTGHSSTAQLLRSLLLENTHEKIREGVVASVRRVCGTMPSDTETKTQEFVSFFWEAFVAMIPQTAHFPHYTEQFFGVALEVFRCADEGLQAKMPLAVYLRSWSTLLLDHKHDEFVGRGSVDWIIFGLSGLLHWCIQLMKSNKRPLDIDGSLVQKLFRTHLFPSIRETSSLTASSARVPVLDSTTRGRIYSVVLALSTDLTGHQGLLSLVEDLIPRGEDSEAWSWGIAQILGDYQYEPNWNFERVKAIRSSTGYPGVRNLSNTCYLNSLFTQLFMNVEFRSFMLSRTVTDGDASQKLLAETQRLFAFMQESWLKCVDPQGIADSVITYESTPIDVSVQMDVDEFYNLLFDRWESQIPSATDKKIFRQFYGGQIVQQIKSKECPHISERLEPFSAIQCEVRGKQTLAESLSAYIEGEVMEGDNKYSCSSCGSYVDAVKRACLKDIPDNLIFHLKRFDYDVSTGMRSKINDNFEFPLEIDMSPYDVEYLKDPEHAATEDKFILVGILVHSGNAESGHYYSYIRERPANTRDECAWVEFNDADVVRFDPSNIPDQCYGGLAEPVAYPPMRYPKTWNAYMLFYQRSSSMELERQKHLPIVPAVPVKESIPLEMMPGIVLENELFIRKFCLFDPEHAKFVKQMLVHFRSFNSGLCSEDHALERRVIWMVLEHVDQIFSRTKDCPEFHTLMDMVAKAASTCPDCCKLTLDWIHHHDHALRNLLLRNPDEERRRKFSKMVLGALRFLREHDSTLYGVDVDNAEHDSMLLHEIPDIDGALQNMVGGLKELWSCLHLHCRAWDEYFELCTGIAQLGRLECAVLHRAAYLNHCLQLLIVDHNTASIKKLRFDIPYLGNYFRMLDKGRKFSFKYLLALLARLLECADFSMESTSDTYENDYQLPVSTGYPLSNMEENIIRFGSDMPRSKGLVFLDKAISGDHNILACQSIVRILTRAESDLELSNAIETTILHGITIDPSLGAKPYLMAALAFCEACTMTKFARHLVSNIALEVETIGCNGGDEHLEFFKAVRRIRNDNLMNAEPAFFYNLVLRYVPRWAPALLIYSDPAVRVETINLLHQLVFSFDTRSMDDEQKADEVNDIAKALCRACLKRITDYIIIPNKQIEASMVEEIVRVVRFCIGTYYQEEDEEEGPSLAVIESGSTLERLQALTVSSPDEALSGEYDSEEVLTDYSNDFP